MLKSVMLVSALAFAAPVAAQDMKSSQTTPPTSNPAPAQPAGDATADPAATPAQSSTAATPADSSLAGKPAGTPVTGPAQIAQVVDTEFPTYDKNTDGNLDKGEFGTWMVALKTASDPTTKADAPATKTWVGTAFTSADKDKSNVVSKAELTSFLSKSAG